MPITKATANVVDFASPSSQIIAVPGDNLLTKYTQAASLTPQGNALSATNRATLIIYPGVYTLSAQWNVNTEFVDIFCIGHQFRNPSVYFTVSNMSVSANDVSITGIGSTTNTIQLSSSLPLNVFQNCAAIAGSFNNSIQTGYASGTYIGCLVSGLGLAIGAFGQIADGTFIDCKSTKSGSFGGSNTPNINSIASGIFIRCETTNSASFGFGGGFSGTATDCIGGSNAFGANTLTPAIGISGTLTRCQGGSGSFGNGGTTSTKINGSLYFCRLTSGTFPTVTSPGITRVCLDGSNVQNNQG